MAVISDLFGASSGLEPLAIPDADLRFMHGFYPPGECTSLLATLLEETPWRQERIEVWGKVHDQPRLTSWHGDPGTDYTYSGVTLATCPWTPLLSRLRSDIEEATGHRYNSVLLNLYRDQHDGVGWHSDNERELGRMPVIASLSLGETRSFRLRHRERKHAPVSIDLTDGSLLLMAGATQRNWQHAIPKERREKGPRINLTFRQIAQSARGD
ncbi:alpha-ketoglutarate-dependent dioxygenase AlkB family protein [Noviherbaspirillum soli]|uniref:alpha-ketoglutarate-dependent dioxygenase AlkB family protein n=1 Tax=Noviherbaspirillum soli TaxID=1064518 RepID=UPI00188A9498|nr:alpha-ketoglutarate-dependent dioxygenase AlkB [Noviherbaspirillum soli]